MRATLLLWWGGFLFANFIYFILFFLFIFINFALINNTIMGALKQAKIERDRNICADYTKMVVEEHRPSSMAITALCKKYKLSQCCVYTILRKG